MNNGQNKISLKITSIKNDRSWFIIYIISGKNYVVFELNQIILNDPILRKYLLDFYRQIFKGVFGITIEHQNNVFR